MRGKISPGKARILEALEGSKGGLSFGELHEATGLAVSILSHYLRELQEDGLVERKPSRRYVLTEPGERAARIQGDIILLSRSEAPWRAVIEPHPKALSPQVIPVEVAIYLSPEVSDLLQEIREDIEYYGGIKAGKRDVLEALYPALDIQLPEMLIERRAALLALNRMAYEIQSLAPEERMKTLRHMYSILLPRRREECEQFLKEEEKEWMSIKAEPRDFTVESILNFEAALVMKVSGRDLKGDREKTKHLLTAYLLSMIREAPLYSPIPRLPRYMAEAGMITESEAARIYRCRTWEDQERVLGEIAYKYRCKVWGEEPAPYKVAGGRRHPPRKRREASRISRIVSKGSSVVLKVTRKRGEHPGDESWEIL